MSDTACDKHILLTHEIDKKDRFGRKMKLPTAMKSKQANKEQAEAEACEGESGDYIYEPSENLGSSHARK